MNFFKYWITTLTLVTVFAVSYSYIIPFAEQRNSTLLDLSGDEYIDIPGSDDHKNNSGNSSKRTGLRSAKINVNTSLPKDITSKVQYKDVDFISTSARSLSENEISLLKIIIDEMPQTLYDYRPWAIISIDFNNSSITRVNPEGVAFASGPYVYVSDVTFKKQLSYDTGTMRGLFRILYHEFTHVAQFFTTVNVPDEFDDNYLEASEITKDWIKVNGWSYNGGKWTLQDPEGTTKYGQTDPVEDMADSVGALLIGDEYSISKGRVEWLVKWLNTEKQIIFLGTIPLSPTINQRKVEASDNSLLNKYKDPKAITQDVMNFQSTETISKKSFATFYNAEFLRRGWKGSLNNNGVGSFTYKEKFKVNIEMDDNPLRVATIIMSVY